MTEQEIVELIRKELLAILEDANNRSRHGSHGAGFGTSEGDMAAGRGTPVEYLIQAIRERLEGGKQ